MFAHCRHVAVFAGKSLFRGERERDSEQVYLITRRRASLGGEKKDRREKGALQNNASDVGKRVESKGNHRDALGSRRYPRSSREVRERHTL